MPVYTDRRTGRLFVQFDIDHKTYKKYFAEGETREFAAEFERKWRLTLTRENILAGIEPNICKEKMVVSKQSRKGIVYVMQCADLYKIGRTRNLTRRLRNMRTQSPSPINLIFIFQVSNPEVVEKKFHTLFAPRRKQGEWFQLNADDLQFLEALSGMTRVPLQKKRSQEGVGVPLWSC